jgi:hypothetical protein
MPHIDIVVDMTSTTIIIRVDDEAIGAIEKMTIRENNGSATLEISRLRLAKSKLDKAFHKGYFCVESQIRPVEIMILEDKAITSTYTSVWFSDISKYYTTTDEWIISEEIKAECESVS